MESNNEITEIKRVENRFEKKTTLMEFKDWNKNINIIKVTWKHKKRIY